MALWYHFVMENIVKYIHMVGLSIWIGSMVTWAVFAPKLNKFDPTKNTTGVLRGSFSKISWASYAVALISGVTIRLTVENDASDWTIVIGALLLAGAVIAFHSVFTNVSDAVRGIFNGVMLLLALIALYLATIYI